MSDIAEQRAASKPSPLKSPVVWCSSLRRATRSRRRRRTGISSRGSNRGLARADRNDDLIGRKRCERVANRQPDVRLC